MNGKKQRQAERFYLFLAAIFIASLVGSNLIFQKFFFFQPLGFLASLGVEGSWVDYRFEVSVGLLPYPITFLVTDLISEIYGRRKADRVVFAGVIASLFTLGLVSIADVVPATSWSPIGDEVFHNVFGLTGVAVFASMLAYLSAQFVDIRIFHFWKRLTKGRKLWLRNNLSTIPSQFIDTLMVLGLLCSVGAIDWSLFPVLFMNGFLYKVLVALIDTPFFYLTSGLAKRHFGLRLEEELG